jgi:hypothetical protein
MTDSMSARPTPLVPLVSALARLLRRTAEAAGGIVLLAQICGINPIPSFGFGKPFSIARRPSPISKRS